MLYINPLSNKIRNEIQHVKSTYEAFIAIDLISIGCGNTLMMCGIMPFGLQNIITNKKIEDTIKCKGDPFEHVNRARKDVIIKK